MPSTRRAGFGHEQAFLIGVRVLSGTIAAHEAGGAYARVSQKR